MKKILLLDAERRSTLSIARSLNKNTSYEICAAGSSTWDICRYSRAVRRHFLYIDPRTDLIGFRTSLVELIKRLKPNLIIPCSDVTAIAIYDRALVREYPGLFALPDEACYFQASDKQACMQMARELGIPVPKEIPVHELGPASFPVVVKPRLSWYIKDNVMIRADRLICSDQSGFNQAMASITKFDRAPLVQELVPGNGYGQFFAAKEGKITAEFAHERVREIPPSGGY